MDWLSEIENFKIRPTSIPVNKSVSLPDPYRFRMHAKKVRSFAY